MNPSRSGWRYIRGTGRRLFLKCRSLKRWATNMQPSGTKTAARGRDAQSVRRAIRDGAGEHMGIGGKVSAEQLTQWAESCLRMNGLGTLVKWEINAGRLSRAEHLTERARRRAWVLFNELVQAGATKPIGYCE